MPLPDAVLHVTEKFPEQRFSIVHDFIQAGKIILIFPVSEPVRIRRSFDACAEDSVTLEFDRDEIVEIPYPPTGTHPVLAPEVDSGEERLPLLRFNHWPV
ncbi:hypothetical protein BME69_25100 [Klebsiella quasipneumoniae subsp. quasipneumoniae]|nr:hypothetical protein BME69_25100 [Klebsiella quasipneumoniae subsp. quasipneumoniae]PNQ12348.1 hypothetical protein A9R11_21950 [Klebsiella pneumoniae]